MEDKNNKMFEGLYNNLIDELLEKSSMVSSILDDVNNKRSYDEFGLFFLCESILMLCDILKRNCAEYIKNRDELEDRTDAAIIDKMTIVAKNIIEQYNKQLNQPSQSILHLLRSFKIKNNLK